MLNAAFNLTAISCFLNLSTVKVSPIYRPYIKENFGLHRWGQIGSA